MSWLNKLYSRDDQQWVSSAQCARQKMKICLKCIDPAHRNREMLNVSLTKWFSLRIGNQFFKDLTICRSMDEKVIHIMEILSPCHHCWILKRKIINNYGVTKCKNDRCLHYQLPYVLMTITYQSVKSFSLLFANLKSQALWVLLKELSDSN